MGMTTRPRGGLLAEINVTPLVDVMLVLLIVFMITASVEKEQKKKKDKDFNKQEELQRKVPIKLPEANAPEVVTKTDKKLVLSIDDKLQFWIDDTNLNLSCALPKGGSIACDETNAAYKGCMKRLGDKLTENQKLQEDKELYLKAFRGLPYGCVLKAMSTIRAAGIVKFGLLAQPESKSGKK